MVIDKTKERKRILLIASPISQDSGILRHILELAQELSYREYDVGLATRLMGKDSGQPTYSKNYFSKFYTYFEFFYLKFPNFSLGNRLAEKATNFYLIFRSFYELKNIIKTYKPDIIHTHSLSACFQVNIVNQASKIPHITTLHQDLNRHYGKYYLDNIDRSISNYIKNYLCKVVAGIIKKSSSRNYFIAISREMKTQIHEFIGVKKEKIILIYHGVNPNRFRKFSISEKKQSRANFGIKSDVNVVCLIGSLDWRKGQDILIKALSILRSENIDVVAILAGTGDAVWEESLEELASSLEVRDLIHLVGYVDASQVLCASDILIAPSRYEAFPLVSIEAMLSGVVPIRTPTSGTQDQIKSGVNGYIVPHEDSDALAHKMKVILSDKALRTNMSASAIKKAQAKFTTEKMLTQTLFAYQNCLSESTQK